MNRQSEIFSRYRSLFNSSSVRPQESESSRRLNNMEFVDFLFELVKATKGQKEFKNVILKGSLSKLKKTDEINKIIREAFKSAFGCDSFLVIPTKYTTKSSLGIELNKSEIDAFGLFGVAPDSEIGRLTYEGNDVTKHVNYFLYIAQGLNVNNPGQIKFNNRVLFEIYAKNPNTFIFKFGEFYENKLFSDWLIDYLSVISPIFNTVNFTSALTDIITGAITIRASRNRIEIRKQLGILKALKKIFGFCSETDDEPGAADASSNELLRNQIEQNSNFNGENVLGTQKGIGDFDGIDSGIDIDPFDFDFNDLKDIEDELDLKLKGSIKFSTCGDLVMPINPDTIIDSLLNVFTTSDENSLYSYDEQSNNQLTQTLDDSDIFDNSLISANAEKAVDFFDDAIKTGATDLINQGETNIVIDFPAINAELQLNILKAIPYALMQMVLTPKITMVPKLFAAVSGDVDPKSVNEFVKAMKGAITKIGSSITNLLIQNIFDSIKSDLIRLAKQLAIAYLKQRGIDYLATLRSLLRLLKLLERRERGCTGVLDKLLRLLKLGNFGPMPILPPPLIFLAGKLKPGINSVAVINDIKSTLIEKGIETAPTLPDGTPNNTMIAIEETVKTLITHLKTNSTIQTFGISAAGPVAGYGQIQ